MYFYSDTAPRSNSDINVWKMNGTNGYLRHYDNFLFLDFIAKNGTRAERASVEKEILICRRKMEFWEKHPNFVAEDARIQVEKKLKDWRIEKNKA